MKRSLGWQLGWGLGWLLACNSGEEGPVSPEDDTARPLGLFATETPAGAWGQAEQALAQDAWRREHRFLDAVAPGHAFAATRVAQARIDAGAWSVRDLYEIGGQLFTFRFTAAEGFGGADLPRFGRVHRGNRGGPDAHRCSDCHWRGGLAGAGDAADNVLLRGDGVREDTATVRNPPALVGAGVVERLASEMTAELQAQRDAAVVFARDAGYPVQVELTSKDVSFGSIVAGPDGTVTTKDLSGVDDDLVVKPFGRKGTFATIREIAEDALAVHHGMQSQWLVEHGEPERVGEGPPDDPDGDGVRDEITEGQVSALTAFVAMQEVPVERPPSSADMLIAYAQGRELFDRLGCADCHRPALPLRDPKFRLPSRIDEDAELEIDLATEAAEPRLARSADGQLEVRLFSDLRRHDMGPDLAERDEEKGVGRSMFVTPPLWGLARSRPYLHDGRAPTIEDAILLHGGEAKRSRDAFEALTEPERAPLRVFLVSLTRADRLTVP